MYNEHLSTIDDQAWPAIARVPHVRFARLRTRAAEAQLAQIARNEEIQFGPGKDLEIFHDALFDRLVDGGWTGLAEGFMAGEWSSENLTKLLKSLIAAGYRPGATKVSRGSSDVGELPAGLVRLYSGEEISAFSGVFSSAISTTVRESVRSYVRGAGHGAEPAQHFTAIRRFEAPDLATRADLGDGQKHAVKLLLDSAGVRAGRHVLEYFSAGGAVAIEAARRNGAVDTLTGDYAQLKALKEQYFLAGVDDAIQLVLNENLLAGAPDWQRRYDAIISVEKLETIGQAERTRILQAMDRMLDVGGKIALQMTVATEKMTANGIDALQILARYIWPGLDIPTIEGVHKVVDRQTRLRIVGQTHIGSHAAASLKFMNENFLAHSREAAAEGFDQVYRRLWDYQFAVRRALLELGQLDVVQFELTHRHRGGHR